MYFTLYKLHFIIYVLAHAIIVFFFKIFIDLFVFLIVGVSILSFSKFWFKLHEQTGVAHLKVLCL